MNSLHALDLDIIVDGGDWPDETQLEALVMRALEAITPFVPELADEQSVNFLFTDDAHVQGLNRDFRGKDKPTNVLSFPGADESVMPGMPVHLGDIALAYETIHTEAVNDGKTFGDHLTHLVIHGILHLLGFDHEDQEEAEEMEDLERKILHTLAIADPYA